MQIRKFVFLSILSLSLALVFLPNHRTTHAAGPWFVSPAGNDANDCLSVGTACLTIQGAVNKASPGDIVNVAAGTYTENVNITKSLIMRGAQTGIDARGRVASESIVTPAVTTTATFTMAFAGGYTIDGFSFVGGTSATQGCIFTSVGPNNSSQIINNRFSGYSTAAIWLNRGGTDITIDKNVLDGGNIAAGNQAIFLNGPQPFAGFQLTNNWIINNTNRYGLFVDGNHNVGESAVRAPLISGNLFDKNLQGMNLGSRSFGTLLAPVLGAFGGTISNNTFSNHAFDGFQGGIQHVLVTNNQFKTNARSGLALTSFGNTGADRGAQNSTITCNLFTGNVVEGIFLSASQVAGSMATNSISQNNIAGNTVGLTYNGTEAVDARNNWWGKPTGPTIASNPGGTGDSITNPSGTLLYNPFLTSIAGCAPAPPLPDLTITKTHVGSFNQGDVSRTYTIKVTNNGAAPTSGTVTVTDSVPAGLTATSIGGTNWNCTQPAGPCTRSDALGVGATYDDLTLTVSVACNAPSTVTNTAQVSGGGESNTGNNTANDPTTVNAVAGPQPTIVCPGGISKFTDSGQFSATVNPGTPTTTGGCGSLSVTAKRSDGKALNAPYPIGVTVITWTVTDSKGQTASCSQSITVMVPSGRRRLP